MEIPLFLAMTATELRFATEIPVHMAWMACHFSAYGVGLSNIPEQLPQGAMLMLNDRTPICGHDPVLVAETLCEAAHNLGCSSILLDFQRADRAELTGVIEAILERASCPVGISSLYASGFGCPVLVSPIAPSTPPEDALAPWEGREIWLELSSEGTEITVTEEGSRYTSLPNFLPSDKAHSEPALYCHYGITVQEDRIRFQLGRTKEDQEALVRAVTDMNVTKTLGLWQEMRS